MGCRCSWTWPGATGTAAANALMNFGSASLVHPYSINATEMWLHLEKIASRFPGSEFAYENGRPASLQAQGRLTSMKRIWDFGTGAAQLAAALVLGTIGLNAQLTQSHFVCG